VRIPQHCSCEWVPAIYTYVIWCYVRYIFDSWHINIKKNMPQRSTSGVCVRCIYITSKPVPADLIGSVRELKDGDRVWERGVKVRPGGRTLRNWQGKGPMVKGGRGHCWEKESERDGASEKERDKRRDRETEKNKMKLTHIRFIGLRQTFAENVSLRNNARGILYKNSCRTLCYKQL